MKLDHKTFRERIQLRMREVQCTYCGARPGEYCATAEGAYAQLHQARFLAARDELTVDGDGFDVKPRRSVP